MISRRQTQANQLRNLRMLERELRHVDQDDADVFLGTFGLDDDIAELRDARSCAQRENDDER